jgi:predicted ArsR family transcriptional regulator
VAIQVRKEGEKVKKTQREVILKTLKGRAKPLSALDIAAKTGVKIESARVVLSGLQTDGLVKLAGTRSSAIGRPQNLYLLAD